MTARGAALQSVALALACLASYALARHASAILLALSPADDQVAGLWAAIATAFVFRTTRRETVTAAKTRIAATALSFALCFAYLLFLHPSALGMGTLIAAGTLVLLSTPALAWASFPDEP